MRECVFTHFGVDTIHKGRVAELGDLLATQREEVEVVLRARESDAKRSAASRETELAQLDARVRKVRGVWPSREKLPPL